ncbi:SsrA-binding protein [bioreactor metagenome]|uniref:SsrA-binding protein n=1 Tax=bioreactor metagenome TaxID=1076179 RepID=A0A644XDE0_9ZZZZ|nr:SsrA-binding protein SmpB [Candidatus Metalachnospira sp.]
MAKEKVSRLIAQNKKAYHEYFIEETYQAGISLTGTEVKSMRLGKCSLKESFIRIENSSAFIYNMHISPYEQGNIFNKEPLRIRRLLLHKHEINKISGAVTATGYTIVPLKVYFYHGLVKIDIGIAKGKKLYDKRQTIAKSDQLREAEKDFKIRNLSV